MLNCWAINVLDHCKKSVLCSSFLELSLLVFCFLYCLFVVELLLFENTYICYGIKTLFTLFILSE